MQIDWLIGDSKNIYFAAFDWISLTFGRRNTTIYDCNVWYIVTITKDACMRMCVCMHAHCSLLCQHLYFSCAVSVFNYELHKNIYYYKLVFFSLSMNVIKKWFVMQIDWLIDDSKNIYVAAFDWISLSFGRRNTTIWL